MIENLNDSKKHYLIWSIVTIVIFLALFLTLMFAVEKPANDTPLTISGHGFSYTFLSFICSYLIATFPIGFYIRRKVMHGYIHVPTEEIKIREENTLVAFFRLIKCEILAVINLILLVFYLLASALFGLVMFPYHLISGGVFFATKKI